MIMQPPLIAHVIYRLGVGGMENGLVNLINNMPPDRYRHAIVCLKDADAFAHRIQRSDVEIIALGKRDGHDLRIHWQLYKALRDLKPVLIHTRNLAALESQIAAVLAGIRKRVHGEHGREGADLSGSYLKYNLLRRSVRPLVNHYTAVSQDLARWLTETIGVSPSRVTQIYNGVDSQLFHPRIGERPDVFPEGFVTEDTRIIGAVGRMAHVKGHATLVRAFANIVAKAPKQNPPVRLVIIGDGPTRPACLKMIRDAGLENLCWLPGERDDIPKMLRTFDVFALPSLGEGISNTILEAMASGLPLVVTQVGGNTELVDDSHGILVPANDPNSMTKVIQQYLDNPARMQAHGKAGRAKVERSFSLEAMVNGYLSVYDKVISNGLA